MNELTPVIWLVALIIYGLVIGCIGASIGYEDGF